MNLGVNTNCQAGKDFKEVLKNIKEVGFNDVMISFNLQEDEETIVEAQNLNLNIPYVHLSYKYGNDLWVKGTTADEYVEEVIKQIELCAKYNINIAVFHCTFGSTNDLPIKPNKTGLENFKKILNVAEKHNINIALENTDKFNMKHFYYLFKKIKSNNLKFCYDVGHHYLYYPKINLLKKFGRKLVALHLHDNFADWQKGYDFTKDLHLLPFDGKINFDKVCKNIAKTNYDGTIMLELHKTSLANLNGYKNLNNLQFLQKAKTRAKKLEGLIKKYKN